LGRRRGNRDGVPGAAVIGFVENLKWSGQIQHLTSGEQSEDHILFAAPHIKMIDDPESKA
jgi:hypothetical protein